MKRWIGILSGFLAAAACALSTALLLVAIGWPVRETQMHDWLTRMRAMPQALLLVAAAILLGAIGVLTLYGLFSARFLRQTSAPIERNALGETAIAFTAIEELCDRTARRRSGVRSCRSKVTAIGNEITISVHVVTSPEESLLTLTHALQDELSARIQDVCGVKIGRVDVTVDQTDEPAAEKRVH